MPMIATAPALTSGMRPASPSRRHTASILIALRYWPSSSCSSRARMRRSSSWICTLACASSRLRTSASRSLASVPCRSASSARASPHAPPRIPRHRQRKEQQHTGQFVQLQALVRPRPRQNGFRQLDVRGKCREPDRCSHDPRQVAPCAGLLAVRSCHSTLLQAAITAARTGFGKISRCKSGSAAQPEHDPECDPSDVSTNLGGRPPSRSEYKAKQRNHDHDGRYVQGFRRHRGHARWKCAFGVFLTACLGSEALFAADEPVTLPAVTVIGSTPLPGVGLDRDQIAAPVQTGNSAQIERSNAIDLPGYLLRFLGSVYVNDIQNNPFQPDINYRGYTASPLLGTPQGLSVYLDGVRLNQPFGDVVSWDLIPRAAIASFDADARIQSVVRPQHAGRRAVDPDQGRRRQPGNVRAGVLRDELALVGGVRAGRQPGRTDSTGTSRETISARTAGAWTRRRRSARSSGRWAGRMPGPTFR